MAHPTASYEDLALWDDLNVVNAVEDDNDNPTHMWVSNSSGLLHVADFRGLLEIRGKYQMRSLSWIRRLRTLKQSSLAFGSSELKSSQTSLSSLASPQNFSPESSN